MRLVRFVPALLVLLPVRVATAQHTKPVVTGTPVPVASRTINLSNYSDPNWVVDLVWKVTQATEADWYAITYDRGETATTQATRVCLDRNIVGNIAEGPVVLNGRVRIRAAQIVDTEHCNPSSETPTPVDRGTRNIVLRVYRAADPFNEASSANYTWNFKYDTKPPGAPTLTAVEPGENRVEVQWAPDANLDVLHYEVVYCNGAATSTTALPCDDYKVIRDIARTQTRYAVTEGVENGQPVSVAVRAVDEVGNVGVLSEVRTVTPSEVLDFFEVYKNQGGAEDGGFCFIATAAYGSYAHPAVRLLRLFRDRVLKTSPLGTFAVWVYYRLSPPIAEAVRRDPAWASVVRVLLMPTAVVAGALVLAPVGALVALGFIALRRRSKTRARLAARVGLLLVALAATHVARADDGIRQKSKLKHVGVAFELKGGPYLPALAEAKEGPDNAFVLVYGKDGVPPGKHPLYSVGLDVQLLRGYGTAAIGGTFGFMQFIGRSRYLDGTPSFDTTVFNLMPLALTASYRFDMLVDRANVPFVPYARGGLAYDVWWVTTGTGDTARWKGTADDPREVRGRGGKLGLTGTLGMAFLLNWIDLGASRNLFETTSIRGTYVFFEYQVNKVDGFGAQGFDFSDSTWNLGLCLEL